MPLQLVAYAMQSRKASGLDALDELELDVLKGLDELDDDDPALHMLSSACRQLALSRELELDDDTPKHAPHRAMMLSTALSHLDDNVDVNLEGQPVPATAKIERTNPRSARFMSLLPTKLFADYTAGARPAQRRDGGGQSVARSITDSQWDSIERLSSCATAGDSDDDRPLSCRSVAVGTLDRDDTRS